MWEWLELDAPGTREIARITVRLALAGVLGGMLGFERESRGKAAGLKTHILVALGAAVFTTAMLEAGGDAQALSAVIQGIATGIGFVGAGTILKPDDRQSHVKGLATAAGVWLTAAIGAGIGAGRFGLSITATLMAFVTMSFLGRLAIPESRREDE